MSLPLQELNGHLSTLSDLTATLISGLADLLDEQRALLPQPTVFKAAYPSASGSTALWVPTTGSRFRLMLYKVEVTGYAASDQTEFIISLLDGNDPLPLRHVVSLPAETDGSSGLLLDTGIIDLGTGILSNGVDNVLNISLNGTLKSGTINFLAFGNEQVG